MGIRAYRALEMFFLILVAEQVVKLGTHIRWRFASFSSLCHRMTGTQEIVVVILSDVIPSYAICFGFVVSFAWTGFHRCTWI